MKNKINKDYIMKLKTLKTLYVDKPNDGKVCENNPKMISNQTYKFKKDYDVIRKGTVFYVHYSYPDNIEDSDIELVTNSNKCFLWEELDDIKSLIGKWFEVINE